MAMPHSAPFGDVLKRLRLSAGLTQEQLAQCAGISVRGISDLERGINRAPRRDTADRLATALQLTAADRARLLSACRVWARPAPARAMGEVEGRLPAADGAPFVGRAPELGQLGHYLAGEGPPLLLVAGEPGIGKSRLLDEVARRGKEQGWAVLRGGCHRRGGQEFFAPVIGALTSRLRGVSPARARLELRGCSWLARLLPELAEDGLLPAPPWSLPAEQEHRLIFEAVDCFLANVAGPRGTLLLLDDAQWACRDALDLLAHLLRSHRETPLRVVLAYRDTELRPCDPLAVVLGDLAPSGLHTRMDLRPLRRDEAARLLRGLLPPDKAGLDSLIAHVVARAGGTPFFLVSCAQGMQAGFFAADASGGMPWDVEQSIRQRVAAMPQGAQAVLQAAAIAGRLVPRAVLLDVAERLGLRSHETLAALEALTQARLLEEERVDGYHFPHDLIREVVAGDLGEARRMALHDEIAQALERARAGARAGGIEALAYHFAHAGNVERALIHIERAGDHARAVYADAEAEEYYRLLVTRLDNLGRTVEAAHARLRLGALLLNRERQRAAIAVLEAAVRAYEQVDDTNGMAEAAAYMAEAYASLGAAQEGIARMHPLAERAFDGHISRGRARLCRGIAALSYANSRFDDMLAWSERLEAMARALADESMLAEALGNRAGYLFRHSELEAAHGVAAESIALAQRSHDLHTLTYTLHILSMMCQSTGDLEHDWRWIERAFDAAERLRKPILIAHTLSRSGKHWLYAGNWARAQADFERADTIARELGVSWLTPHALLDLGTLRLVRGQLTEGTRHLEQAIALAGQWDDVQALRQAHRPLAERDLLQGRPDAAQARLLPLLDRHDRPQTAVTSVLPLLAWAQLDQGDAAAAANTLAECIQRASDCSMWPSLAEALRVRAMLALRRGHLHDAESDLARALAISRQIGFPYNEAKVLCTQGAIQERCGREPEARASLAAALSILSRLGERLYASQAERLLEALEVAPETAPVLIGDRPT